MSFELKWNPNFSASALHAAERHFARRTLLDAKLAEAIHEPTAQLAKAATGCRLPLEKFWQHLLPLAAQIENNRQLAQRISYRLLGAERTTDMIQLIVGGAIADLEAAYRRAVPDIDEQLRLRVGPLREMWEARGPGLLRLIGERTEKELIVPSAEVILVQPVTGGWGAAHLPYNSVSIEAVLTNPRQDLPEVVRLAWLLAQLNCDLATYSQTLPAAHVPFVSQLAMIPPVLAAAEEVELVRFDPSSIAAALEVWDLPVADRAATAATLWQWFEVYRQGDTRWRTALEALDQLISR